MKFNHDSCSEDSLETLSNYENSNKSYVIKLDYIGFESICVPIFNSTKLLDYIKIDDENITTNENKEFDKDRYEINKTMVTENNNTKTYPLECIIKNYKQTCDEKEAKESNENEIKKTVDIHLTHANKPTSNITEIIYNYTEASIIFEKCVLYDYLCTNSNTIDEYSESNNTISRIILTSIGNKDSSVSTIMNNNIKNLNCTNIINKYKNIKISHIKALTNSIITKYYCQDEDNDQRNFNVLNYDVSVYLSIDLNILNSKLKYINCTGNFKPKNSTGLNINCNVNDSLEMYMKMDNYTTTSGNNNLPDITLFEEDYNQSFVYHCILKKVNTTTDSYFETTEIFNKYKIFDYQTCIEEFNTDDKKVHLDGSKILVISEESHNHDFTNLEDFGSYSNRDTLKLYFIHSNISDCNEKIPLNITKGRIITLWPVEDKELVYNDFDSTLFKLLITNCDNYTTKYLENENNLELDIILTNTNNTRFYRNETKVNKLKNPLGNNTTRAILNCAYFNENTQLYNNNSVLECIFLESNNNIMTTTVEAPTFKNPIENQNVNISDRQNDLFNVHDKGINTTTKTPKLNDFGTEKESKNNGKIRNDKKYLKGNVTTEKNPWRENAAVQKNQTDVNDPLQEMYYVSPRVLTTAIVSLLAVVGSVITYALCIFRKKKHAYRKYSTSFYFILITLNIKKYT